MATNPQAIANPFEPQPTANDDTQQQAIANPFEDAAPATTPLPANDHAFVAPQKGFRGWLQDLEDDVRYGSDHTIIGKALKKMGAQGINVGAQGNSTAGDTLASPILGPTKMAKGVVDAASGGRKWQATKELIGGALQTAEIPGAFIAPEASEVASDVSAAGAAKVADVVGAVADKLSPARAAKKTATTLLDTLDNVASDAGLTPSSATSASGKVADMVAQLKSKAQEIYAPLDEASGGRFQRFRDEIADIQKYINRTTSRAEAAQLRKQLAEAQANFEEIKKSIVDSGVADPADIAKADALWKQAKALETVGKKLRNAEKLNGELKDTPAVLDNAVKNIDTVRPGTLERAVGPSHASTIRNTVANNTDAVASATRNRKIAVNTAKIAGTGAVGGVGASILMKVLGGEK